MIRRATSPFLQGQRSRRHCRPRGSRSVIWIKWSPLCIPYWQMATRSASRASRKYSRPKSRSSLLNDRWYATSRCPKATRDSCRRESNGKQELTYRRVLENDVEISRSAVKSVILQEALPEIVMVGAQSSFAPLPIPGKLAFLAGGNAWIIDTSTATRTALVTTGDLDGRIFKLSPNGTYPDLHS